MGVLNGIKVLELTQGLSGPFCTMILGDMGAEVIKIEKPGNGDDSRAFGPFVNGESAYFMSVNRNKKSMAIDLRTLEGLGIFEELAKEADVVIENYKPGTMDKLGTNYERIKAINKSIIYCSISGYGQDGPFRERPAYDAVIQAMSGMMSITGQENESPTRVGAPVGDMTAALYGVIGIMGALYRRKDRVVGERIDISILDCQISILENAIMRYNLTGEIPGPIGNRHASIAPFETYMTRNNEIMVAIGNDNIWADFCRLVNKKDLVNDYRFYNNEKRIENYHELKPILNKIFIENTTEEWQKSLDESGIPNSPINTIDKLFDNEQVKARNMLIKINHPIAGDMIIPNSPIKFMEEPYSEKQPSPMLGEHTSELLKSRLNMNEEDIEQLIKKSIIQ
ncbi:MAG: Formyl-CoA transferase [Clostridiales bacterium 38_11]|nr:MAG: Formyl-CoA transferase [Clostridiales bacterium 38_11]HBH13032.1 carnitine dehydratase [Clostridiales bacterium]